MYICIYVYMYICIYVYSKGLRPKAGNAPRFRGRSTQWARRARARAPARLSRGSTTFHCWLERARGVQKQALNHISCLHESTHTGGFKQAAAEKLGKPEGILHQYQICSRPNQKTSRMAQIVGALLEGTVSSLSCSWSRYLRSDSADTILYPLTFERASAGRPAQKNQRKKTTTVVDQNYARNTGWTLCLPMQRHADCSTSEETRKVKSRQLGFRVRGSGFGVKV